MGEKVYRVGKQRYNVPDLFVQFSESDDRFGCLCTFPHNDGEQLTVNRIKSLALLGAVVALSRIADQYADDERVYIPDCLPDWIVEAIDQITLPGEHDAAKEL